VLPAAVVATAGTSITGLSLTLSKPLAIPASAAAAVQVGRAPMGPRAPIPARTRASAGRGWHFQRHLSGSFGVPSPSSYVNNMTNTVSDALNFGYQQYFMDNAYNKAATRARALLRPTRSSATCERRFVTHIDQLE